MAKLIEKIKAITEYKISLTEDELNYLVVLLGQLTKDNVLEFIKEGSPCYGNKTSALNFVKIGGFYNLYDLLSDFLTEKENE